MASRKPRRGLTADDRDVWKTVTKTITPIKSESFGEIVDGPVPAAKKDLQRPIEPFRIEPQRQTQISVNLAPNITESLKKAPPQMDRKNFDRLRKGKMNPDARVDLHGMTAQVAHAVLTQFILSAHASGARLVLVITGKGRTHRDEGGVMPARKGIIRHSVPDWLRQPPLVGKVVQVIPAHRKHGGDGAYYVYLRRKR